MTLVKLLTAPCPHPSNGRTHFSGLCGDEHTEIILVGTTEPLGSQRALDLRLAHPHHYISLPFGRAAEQGGARDGSAGAGPALPGPLFSLLAALECVWLQEPLLGPGLHARHQVPAGSPLPPRQHLPGEVSPTPGTGGLRGAFSI